MIVALSRFEIANGLSTEVGPPSATGGSLSMAGWSYEQSYRDLASRPLFEILAG